MSDGVPITTGSGLGVATDEVFVNLTGTVAKNATTTVTGTGTAFLSEISVGQVIRVPGGTGTEDRIVAAITSDTALTVTAAFTTTASGQVAQRVAHAQIIKQAVSADGSRTLIPADATLGLAVQITASPTSATVTRSQVADTTTEGVVLAANTNRQWASMTNDSSSPCFVALGTSVASATDYTVRLQRYDFYTLPSGYTGAVRAVWQSPDPNDGALRISEGTP